MGQEAQTRAGLEECDMEFMVFLAIIVVIGLVIVLIYNRLVALRQTTRQAWGDIDVQLKQRHDLVPNLVETVKGYAAHESQTLENVVKARQQAVDASSVKDLAQAENMLSGALRQLFALSEAYPDLKANQNFLKLQNELADLENKIAAARRFFNNAVSEYNTAIEQFPAVVLAGMFGFTAKEFFEIGGTERATPSVSF
jgi:LemA protein